MAKGIKESYSITTNVNLPADLAYDDNLRTGIVMGFENRTQFFVSAMEALKDHVDRFGVADGVSKFKAKLRC